MLSLFAEISTIAGDGGSDDELLRPVGLTASDQACSFTRVRFHPF